MLLVGLCGVIALAIPLFGGSAKNSLQPNSHNVTTIVYGYVTIPGQGGVNGKTVGLYEDNLDNCIATCITANDANGQPGYYYFEGYCNDYYNHQMIVVCCTGNPNQNASKAWLWLNACPYHWDLSLYLSCIL